MPVGNPAPPRPRSPDSLQFFDNPFWGQFFHTFLPRFIPAGALIRLDIRWGTIEALKQSGFSGIHRFLIRFASLGEKITIRLPGMAVKPKT